MKNFFLFFLFFLTHTVNTQVYYCGDDSRIGVFNVADCSYTTLPTNNPTIFLADITFTPEGRLIGIGYTADADYLIELFLDNGVRFDTLLEIPSCWMPLWMSTTRESTPLSGARMNTSSSDSR